MRFNILYFTLQYKWKQVQLNINDKKKKEKKLIRKMFTTNTNEL